MKKQPPDWLINHPVVEDFGFSKDINDWAFRSPPYSEVPEKVTCTHRGKGEPEKVEAFSVQYGSERYVIAGCKVCGTVLWFEIALK